MLKDGFLAQPAQQGQDYSIKFLCLSQKIFLPSKHIQNRDERLNERSEW
jgi:hypothetical protein